MADAVHRARDRFPRGLDQPETGYRFSLDSLLLGCFVRAPKQGRGADLGAGCGVVAFTVLINNLGCELFFDCVERDGDMIERTLANRALLGFQEVVGVVHDDVLKYRSNDQNMDFVVANPPYRSRTRGRVSPDPSRDRSRFEDQAGLEGFARAATRCLKDKAPLYLVHLPERLHEIADALRGASLEMKRIQFVHSRMDEPARIMLVEARKNGGAGVTVEPPLVLYDGRGHQTALTAQALAFCPFLECNVLTRQAVETCDDP